MPIVIRKSAFGQTSVHCELNPDVWDLIPQIEELFLWIKANCSELADESWVADIGFAPRYGARGGGPKLTRELMQLCLQNRMEIWLSEYPPHESGTEKMADNELTSPLFLQTLKQAQAANAMKTKGEGRQ